MAKYSSVSWLQPMRRVGWQLGDVDLILDSQIDQLHKVVRIMSIQYKKLWSFWTSIWQKTLGEP